METGAKIGGDISGKGYGQYTTDSRFYVDHYTRRSEPVVLRGAYWDIHDLAFVADQEYNDTAILVASKLGLNAGRNHLYDLAFHGYATAIQFGDTDHRKGCDTSDVDRIEASHCGTVIRTRTSMAMSHSFRDVHTAFCDIVWDCVGGGANALINCSVNHVAEDKHCTVLRVSDGRLTSHNNGQLILERIKIDNNCDNRVTLVEMTDSANVTIKLEGGIYSPGGCGPDAPQFVMMPLGHLVVEDYNHLQPGAIVIKGDPKDPAVVIDIRGCTYSGDNPKDLIAKSSTGRAQLTYRGLIHHKMRYEFKPAYRVKLGAWQ